MTALSELLHSSSIEPARAIERIESSEDHRMDRGTVYRYLDGQHPDRPAERYLLALAHGFSLPITEVRSAAKVPVGELGPWVPPKESGRLSRDVRKALDELIVTLAKEGTGHVATPAKKRPSRARGKSSGVTPADDSTTQ